MLLARYGSSLTVTRDKRLRASSITSYAAHAGAMPCLVLLRITARLHYFLSMTAVNGPVRFDSYWMRAPFRLDDGCFT